MYSYLYDTFVNEKKYEREIARIEGRLANLQISGKITRLTVFRNLILERWIKEEIEKGVKTVVAVGDDHTLHRLIEVCASLNLVIGFIPFNQVAGIGSFFNIPQGVEACSVISRRKIKKIDLGRVNDHYFLSKLTVQPKAGLSFICNKAWTMSFLKGGTLSLYNAGFLQSQDKIYRTNPEDGKLEGLFEAKQKRIFPVFSQGDRSTFFVKSVAIKGKDPFKINYDTESLLTREAKIETVPQKIRLIVGSGV